MNMTLKMWFQIAIGVISYGVWAFMAYDDPSLRPDFLHFNMLLAGGTVGLVVRDMKSDQPTQDKPTDKAQS